MNSERKTANAVGGMTIRACDSCLRRRARWFCAADDAFLCQGCDTSVHSANQLARRHERVRLETASFKAKNNLTEHSSPAWHRGFTRKARTPRQSKRSSGQLQSKRDDEDKVMNLNPFPLVPEIGSEEGSQLDETEEQLLYRVPVFDPFTAELRDISNETENIKANEEVKALLGNQINVILSDSVQDDQGGACGLDNLQEFLSSETEPAEFAADVESLLRKGLDEDSSGIKLGLGLIGSKEDVEERRLKLEDEEVAAVIACHLDPALDKAREGFDWNFNYGSPVGLEKEQEQKMEPNSMEIMAKANSKYDPEMRRKRLLRLNYEEVITAWSSHSQGSPWTTGARPDFNLDDCWPDFMCAHSVGFHGANGGVGGRMAGADGAREARVLRYREKRRTRLFSRKIRYEVRKLNAEKRPRMKGRFVKRTAFARGPA